MKITVHKEQFDKLVKSRNLLIGLVIFLTIIVFFFILNTINANKINWGMKIANVSVSGLYPQEAQDKLEKATQDFLEKDFFLNYKEDSWQITPEELGVEINLSNTINTAFNKGHQKNKLLANAWWQIKSLFGYNTKPIWNINDEKLEEFLQKNLSLIHQPAINASLVYNQEKEDFITTNSEKGVIVNKNKLKKELTDNINNFQQKDILLSLIEDYPEVLESETQKAEEKAKQLLERVPIDLVIQESSETEKIDSIDKEKLLYLMSFEPISDKDNKILGVKFKQETIKDYLITLAPLVNREPINAQLTIRNDRVTAFALSQEGIRLEIEDNIPILAKELLNPPVSQEIELKTNKTQPKITTDSINNLGITDLLAIGVSNFSGSPRSRIHNIKIGTAKFNGVLIRPNEEFSFNNILGEIGPEQGYEPELVIKKDKTIPEYGGGLCQVSTTMFRAAIYAGLEITQRYPHAFPVKYYNPQGLDATIYPPFPDLRFVNNTPSYILVQTKINDYDLIFEFYGTDDNRKIEISGPYQYDIEEDGSMKARLIQKVYDEDKGLIIDKTFYSNYKSPNLYPVEGNPLE